MEIQLGSILENACAMAGYDTQYQTPPARWRVMAAAAVNEGLRRIHAEKFPALRRIEFRRYRPEQKPPVLLPMFRAKSIQRSR